jgi:flagellar biogenesis protein FliO
MEIRQLFSVLLVFALLGLAVWALRRGGAMGQRGALRIGSLRIGALAPFRLGFGRRPGRERSLASVERLTLTPQHSLHLVRIQGREVVVATYPHGCAVLTEGLSPGLSDHEPGFEA